VRSYPCLPQCRRSDGSFGGSCGRQRGIW
jgi:hypothetical protein